MDDRLRWKPGSGGSGGDVEAAGSTAVIRPRSKGPAGAAAGGMGSKVRAKRQQGTFIYSTFQQMSPVVSLGQEAI